MFQELILLALLFREFEAENLEVPKTKKGEKWAAINSIVRGDVRGHARAGAWPHCPFNAHVLFIAREKGTMNCASMANGINAACKEIQY